MNPRLDLPLSLLLSLSAHGVAIGGLLIFGTSAFSPPTLQAGGGIGVINVSFEPGLAAEGVPSAISEPIGEARIPPEQSAPQSPPLTRTRLLLPRTDSGFTPAVAKSGDEQKDAVRMVHQRIVPRSVPGTRASTSGVQPTPELATSTVESTGHAPCPRGTGGDGNPCGAGGSASEGGGGGGAGFEGLAAIHAPKPPYPWAARRAGFEGRVLLSLKVDPAGAVRDAAVLQTSGREDCDSSALETVLTQWRFRPASLHGAPIEWQQQVAIVYRLE